MILLIFFRGTLYQVRNHIVYRESKCKFPARCLGVEYFLTKLAKTVPNLEVIINVFDWPQVSLWFGDLLPVLSFSKVKPQL